MIQNDLIDFFDMQDIINEEVEIHRYTVISEEGAKFTVFISFLEDYVAFTLVAPSAVIVGFDLHNVISVKFDKNTHGAVRCLF